MTSAIRGPKLPLVAGCLRGLVALMYNFTKSVDEGIFFFYVKGSDTFWYSFTDSCTFNYYTAKK